MKNKKEEEYYSKMVCQLRNKVGDQLVIIDGLLTLPE